MSKLAKGLGHHPSSATQVRLRLLLGALTRPEITDKDAARLRKLITSPGWKQVPRIPSANVLEPVFIHHLLQLKIDPRTVFEEAPESSLRPPSFVELMHQWARRREEILAIARAIESSDATRVMLFKGIAIAPMYSSPALRQMVDFDLIAHGDNLTSVRKILEGLGWRCSCTAVAETWSLAGASHTIDLHAPADPLASPILERSEPATAILPSARILRVPAPTDHLVLIALHCADNAGNRIWRDVCDAQALIAHGASGLDALSAVRDTRAFPPLEAFLAFLSRWCGRRDLPSQPTSREGRRLLTVYESASAQTTSPVALDLIGSLLVDAPAKLVGRLWGRRPTTVYDHSTAVERDPLLGTLPRPGTSARVRLRLSLLMAYARAGQLPRILHLAYRQARLRKNRRLFNTPLL